MKLTNISRFLKSGNSRCHMVAAALLFALPAQAFEVFAKGNLGKHYQQAADEWTVSLSGAAGVAFTILPRVRVEGRYTLISSQQSKLSTNLESEVFTLSDLRTQTTIYSVGLEIDILGDKARFQPYIAIGAGYIESARSYYASSDQIVTPVLVTPETKKWISANLGVGFRVMIGRQMAFEVEAVGYGLNIHQPGALVDWDAKLGVRLFL